MIAATQVGLSALTAVLFFLLCRRFLSRWVSAAVAVTWLLLGNHSSLDHWASGMIAQVALILLLTGVLALIRAEDTGRTPLVGTLLVACSAMSYEATILAAGAAVVAVPLACRRHLPWRRVAWQLGIVGAVGMYLVAGSYHFDEDQGWLRVGTLFNAHFGSAVLPPWGRPAPRWRWARRSVSCWPSPDPCLRRCAPCCRRAHRTSSSRASP